MSDDRRTTTDIQYYDVLKATLKTRGVPITYTRQPRYVTPGLRDYEEKRCDALREKRLGQKAIMQPPSKILTPLCVVSAADYVRHNNIGLHCHNRTHSMLTEVEMRRRPTDGSLSLFLWQMTIGVRDGGGGVGGVMGAVDPLPIRADIRHLFGQKTTHLYFV